MDDLLRKALAEQESKLRNLNSKLAELKALQEERDKVHSLVSQIRYNLGMPPFGVDESRADNGVEAINIQVSDSLSISDSVEVQVSPKPGPPTKALWIAARDILSRARQPLPVQSIASELRNLGYGLEGRAGLETVRAALSRRSDVFKKVGSQYAVVGRKLGRLF